MAWESYFAGYQDGEVKAINDYRKTKELKLLPFNGDLSAIALDLGAMLRDSTPWTRSPQVSRGRGLVLTGHKVKDNDWYAAGLAAGYKKIKGHPG